jgi:hypothetical protein
MSTRQVYQDLVHETSASGEHRTLQWTDRRYDPTMEFETWFHGNIRAIVADPAQSVKARDYTNIKIIRDGPPIAHAVAAGSSRAECGTDVQVLPHGFPWSHPVPDWWERCPECVARQPL